MVEVPVYNPDYLPSLQRDAHLLPRLAQWAAEFDTMDDERYTALQFVEWLELELSPSAKPVPDYPPSYRVLGAAALVVGG